MNTTAEGANAQARDLLDAMFLTMRRIRREGMHTAPMSYADLMILGYLSKSPGRGVSTPEEILDWVARDAETAGQCRR